MQNLQTRYVIAIIATIPPTTPPAMAATFGLGDDGDAVALVVAAAAAQVVDWQVSQERTSC